jgi:uncharacterized lipoprotein
MRAMNGKAMKKTNLLLLLISLWAISACGSSNEFKSCDEVKRYQLAAEGKRIETPDDLDDLEPLREMPLPKASPRPERPDGSPCLDLPPSVLTGEK